MSRKAIKKSPFIESKPDRVYNSLNVSLFIKMMMKSGHYEKSAMIFYRAIDQVVRDIHGDMKDEAKRIEEGLSLFEQIIRNVSPQYAVESRRIGGANYQVPIVLPQDRRLFMAISWIVRFARKGRGPMWRSLASEFKNAYEKRGAVMQERQNTHRMAEANRALTTVKFKENQDESN
jgi:small subunit ribosomal protein S7